MIRLTKQVRRGMIEILSHVTSGNSQDMDAAIKWLQHYVDTHEVVGGKITHGGWTYHKNTYKTWQSMIQRCENKNHKAYASYGGRGISVCDSWHSFEVFFQDMGNPPDGLSLDRIDNDKGYSPENCRWSDKLVQARNRRTTIFVDFKGDRKPLVEVCAELGVSYSTAKTRLLKGYPLNIVLSKEKFMGQRNVGELKSAEVIKP